MALDGRTMSAEVIIIGAGAAGVFAAAVLAQEAPMLRVLVLEKGSRPLAKVRISGGGRCNLTHQCDDIREFVKNYPRGSAEMIGPFHRFGPAETVEWFEQHGVPLITLADGCLFPRSDTSEDVIRALLMACDRGCIEIRTGSEVASIQRLAEGFQLAMVDGRRAECGSVVVTTGGGSFVDGLMHTIEPCVPALFAFNSSDRELAELAGLVVSDVRVSALGFKADGDLLITHRGVSGPAVLRLSSFAARKLAEEHYRFDMKINWLPDQSESQIIQTLEHVRKTSPRKQIGSWSPVGIASRLWKVLVTRAGLDVQMEWGHCSQQSIRQVVMQIHGFTLNVTGQSTHREEFVTCGGIRLSEVNFKTMESRVIPDLYFAGEVLDLDALTGGFNLQAAWTTGYLVAQSLANNKK